MNRTKTNAKAKLGKSNLEVSAIGLGCMGMSFGYGPPKDKQEMISVVRGAFKSGGRGRPHRPAIEMAGRSVGRLSPQWYLHHPTGQPFAFMGTSATTLGDYNYLRRCA
jgi:hypothetical protein